jgi:Ala-tRNA(Pro) deacylase
MATAGAARFAMTTPATPQDLFVRLEQFGIPFTTVEHPAAFTVEDLAPHVADIPGVTVKNLFLCDAKKKMWLVVVPHDRRIDLKSLPEKIGGARMSFGSADRLMRVLGVTPGSVTPFAVINDPTSEVQVILDAEMMEQDMINAHPLINTMTTSMTPAALMQFIVGCGHRPRLVAF